MQAQITRLIVLVVLACGLDMITAQTSSFPAVTVKELPPEAIPSGPCTESQAGYLGFTKAGKEKTRLTDKQIGEYVRVRLSQGYSVSLYPQVSGKIYAVATCESSKH
jgi:hypothetical protein